MPPASPTRRIRALLYVDDSTHWHRPARLLGEYLRAVDGDVVVTSAQLLPGTRARVLNEAQRIVDLPEDRVRLVGRPGLIEYTLPELAREHRADIVVVGRLGSMDRLTSGLIAHLVVKRTPTSVLISRGRPEAIRRILVCTEGAQHGRMNFDRAARIAQAFGAHLTVLHVLSQMGLTDTGQEELERTLRDFIHSDTPEAAHLRDLEARMEEMGVKGEVSVRAGLVVEEILGALHEGGHDLLVIGAHDTPTGELNVYEDFASLILRSSPVSTLVVRDGSPPKK